MFKSFLIISLKRILRYNTYSLINILGLSIGLASFIMIGLYVYDEYSYDKYHSKSERIFRVSSVLDFSGVGEKSASQPFPLAQALKDDYPQYVESYVRFFNMQKSQFLIKNGNKRFNEKRFFFTDANIFDVFDFELIKGNKNEVLKKPFSIVITESMARKYFEDLDPIGKKLLVDNYLEFEVTGVIKEIKPQSHFKFDFLASFSSLPVAFKKEDLLKGWIWNPCWTYILLKDPKYENKLSAQLDNFVKKHMNVEKNSTYELSLQALTDIHLKSKLDYEIEKNGSEKYVRFLLLVGFLVLIIASINYVNLATASAANRAKEIGIKKASGAGRKELILQFLSESLVNTLISLLIAISIVEVFLPSFSELTGKVITNNFRFRKETLFGIFGLWLYIGIVSGLYPAFFLSSFKTVNLLHRNFKLGPKSTDFRKSLVFVQFSISILLIIATVGIFRQINYLHNADLGFRKNNIVIIDAGFEVSQRYPDFKDSLLKNNNIKEVTGMNYIIGSSHNTYPFIPENSKNEDFQFYPAMFVRNDFVKTFEIQMVAGQDFNADEKSAGTELLVNEEMVKYLGYEKNEDIIGKLFFNGRVNEKVVGVISNINVSSLHNQVEPFIINMVKDSIGRNYETRYIVIQINPDEIVNSLASIEKTWKNMGFERPFEYRFLHDILDQHYKSEDILGNLARIFTFLSIVISLIGIWGLTAYITERRTREIGIRKTLGASILNIVGLINKEFFAIVFLSILIAWPLAYYALSSWIKNFAFREVISIWSFIIATMIAVFIAVVTISQKAFSSGQKNPVDALRYE